MSRIQTILEYKRIYANWVSVLYSLGIRNEKIIKIKLRNGRDRLKWPLAHYET